MDMVHEFRKVPCAELAHRNLKLPVVNKIARARKQNWLADAVPASAQKILR